jgi:hypothetical protein
MASNDRVKQVSACAVHDFRPVEKMRAVYRCAVCGGFAYKLGARTNVGDPDRMQMYKCRHPGCADRVVVIYPTVRGRRRQHPSCQAHRPDIPQK